MQPIHLFYELNRNYQSNQYCDLELCGGSHETTPIRCHKLVICSLIPDWQELVNEDTDRIHLPDVGHSDLKRLIDGLYAQLAQKHESWAHFDPTLLAFLRIGPKVGQDSKRPEPQSAPLGGTGNEELSKLGGVKIEYDWNPEKSATTSAVRSQPLPPKSLQDRVGDAQLVALGGTQIECDWNLNENASIWDTSSPNQEQPSATQAIINILEQEDLNVGLFDISKGKQTPTSVKTTQTFREIKSSQTIRTSLVSEISDLPSTGLDRLLTLKQHRDKIETLGQTQTIDVESVQNQLQGNNPGALHINVTTSNLKPYLPSLNMKSMTVHKDAFFALVGIQRRGSEILGTRLAHTTQDVETINSSFSTTIEAYMKVYGFARVPLLSANSYYTRNGSVKTTKANHIVNDLHRKLLYKCTRKDLEDELNQPDMLHGLSTYSPTRKDVQLPIANYDIRLTQDYLDYEDIIIVGVHKHGVEARQMEITDISEDYVAHFCSRVLTLIWVGGNGLAVFPPCDKIMLINRANIRLKYILKTSKKLLASGKVLPRSLPIFTCEICGKQIQENTSMSQMINHKKYHVIQQYKCDCDINFTSFSHKKKHYDECFSKKKPKQVHRPNLSGEQDTHVCDVCGKVVTSKLALKHHTRTNHQNITCKSCNEKFSTAMAYRKHLKQDHSGQDLDAPTSWLRCSECNEVFPEKVDLSKHWSQCHGSEALRPFKCGLCPKSFVEKPKLKVHVMSAHIKSRPYQCRWGGCSSTFNFFGNLYSHEQKLHGASLGPTTPLNTVVKDSQLLEMGCQLKPSRKRSKY